MQVLQIFATIQLILFAMASPLSGRSTQPKALVYRSKLLCDGCPEAVAHLLKTSPSNFTVEYVGPKEKTKLSQKALQDADVLAVGGGPDLKALYKEVKDNVKNIQSFVQNGGRYLGFCLGAYLAGEDPGLEILAPGCDTNEEIYEPGAQVKTLRDAVVQVDWTYATGPKKGQTQNDVWMYFQDGAVIDVPDNATTDVQIVARYSSNGDIASTINTFGKGRVGVVGVHPEAQPIWYQGENFTNPDGVNYTYGYDFVEAVWDGGK